MFTVEMDHDEISITVIDDYNLNEDLNILLYEDCVFIRQFDETQNKFVTIGISPDMWEELLEAMNRPEGAYVTIKKATGNNDGN